MTEKFLKEFEEKTSPYDYKTYRKYGEALIRLEKIDESSVKLHKIIAFDPFSANSALKFICYLADEFQVIVEGEVEPTVVGPSIIKKNVFFFGIEKNRLIQWYKHYGAEIIGSSSNGSVLMKRKPKNEIKS